MGGRALKRVTARRISRAEYGPLLAEVHALLLRVFTLVQTPPDLRFKDSFGDIDVSVAGFRPPGTQPGAGDAPDRAGTVSSAHPADAGDTDIDWSRPWTEIVQQLFHSQDHHFQPPTYSFEYKGTQVDVHWCESASALQMHCDFKAHGELNVFIRTIATSLGVSFGVQGLFVPLGYDLVDGHATWRDVHAATRALAQQGRDSDGDDGDVDDDGGDDDEAHVQRSSPIDDSAAAAAAAAAVVADPDADVRGAAAGVVQTPGSLPLSRQRDSVRRPPKPFGQVLLSTDMSFILPLLGFDYGAWLRGFDAEDELFRFVVQSRYFRPSLFRTPPGSTCPALRPSRQRDRVTRLFARAAALPEPAAATPVPDPDDFRRAVLQRTGLWAHALSLVQQAEQARQAAVQRAAVRQPLSKATVAAVTGLRGTALRRLWKRFRRQVGPLEAYLQRTPLPEALQQVRAAAAAMALQSTPAAGQCSAGDSGTAHAS